MGRLNVFRNLTTEKSRLGFYTSETRDRIPELPGCYAWFLPLWCYDDDLDQLIQLVRGVLDYEQQPEQETKVRFNWDAVKLRVSRESKHKVVASGKDTWDRLMNNKEDRDWLQEILLEASLFMPPLYVGRTTNLKQRYIQHVEGWRSDNTFRSRFTECEARIQLDIGVSDLLFVSIVTRKKDDVEHDDVESLIEQILMQFCRPVFSLK